MTVKDAIKNINALYAVCRQKDFFDYEFETALMVAIEALERELPIVLSHKRHQALYAMANDNNGFDIHLVQLDDNAPSRGMFDMAEVIDYFKNDAPIIQFNDTISAQNMIATIKWGLENIKGMPEEET